MLDQVLIGAIILAALVLFLWGKWRTDIVAIVALFSALVVGLIPLEEMFSGFIHPVVILVIAMVVISKALVKSGVIDIVARHLKFGAGHPMVQVAILTGFTALLSTVINSLGALAFVIPIAIRMSKQTKTPLGMFLLPLAFASHFGGSITLVGSVSNIIVSGFREAESAPFGFFDFASVALPVAVVGVVFISIASKWLVPKRKDAFEQSAALERFATEVKVPKTSNMIGKTLREFKEFTKEDFSITALVRGEQRMTTPSEYTVLREDDILLMEAEADALESIVATAELEMVWKKPFSEKKEKETEGEELSTMEVVVPPSSSLRGETAKALGLHHNYHVNLLAIHRSRGKVAGRLSDAYFQQSDVLVIQGYQEDINRFVSSFGLLSLKERELHFEGKRWRAALASVIFVTAIALSVFAVFPIHIIFAFAALALVLAGFLPPKEVYQSVDMSIVVLLAVMLQLGFVFQETGAASTLANSLFALPWHITPQIALAALLLTSIWLSDILSNATVAVIFAPVALSMAQILGVSPDPFLVAVAIGSASSYLTPIGHQSNTFVMSMGGYKFGDYWKLGLPLEIITFAIALPLILRYWAF